MFENDEINFLFLIIFIIVSIIWFVGFIKFTNQQRKELEKYKRYLNEYGKKSYIDNEQENEEDE